MPVPASWRAVWVTRSYAIQHRQNWSFGRFLPSGFVHNLHSFGPDRQRRDHGRARTDIARRRVRGATAIARSEEHTSELQSLMRISYAVFCLKKKTQQKHNTH